MSEKILGHGEPQKSADTSAYQRDLSQSSLKFENAFQSYQFTSDTEEKTRLKAIMDQQLGIIRSAVRELKLRGISKQESKVEADYKAYLQNASPENQAALEHDIQTLRDYNALMGDLPPQ